MVDRSADGSHRAPRESGSSAFPGASVGSGDRGALIYYLGRRMVGRPNWGSRRPGSLLVGSLQSAVDAPGQQRRSARSVHHIGTAVRRGAGFVSKMATYRPPTDRSGADASWSGGRIWNLVRSCALGLGILDQGPSILLLVVVCRTIIPYLAFSGRLVWGLAAGRPDSRSRPVRHLAIDLAGRRRGGPRSERLSGLVLEMSEKTGVSQILAHRRQRGTWPEWPRHCPPMDDHRRGRCAVMPFLSAKNEIRLGNADQSGDARTSVSLFSRRPGFHGGGPGNLDVFCCRRSPTELLRPVSARYGLVIGSTWFCLAGGPPEPWSGCSWLPRCIWRLKWVIFRRGVGAPLVLLQWLPRGSLAVVSGHRAVVGWY